MRSENVLREVEEGRNLIIAIKRSQMNWIGYVVKGEDLLKVVMPMKISWRKEEEWNAGFS